MGMLRIEVRDSGKGFAAEDQEKIAADFLRFNGQDLQGEGGVHIFSPFLSLIVVVTVDVDFIRQRGSRTLDSSRDCEIAPG